MVFSATFNNISVMKYICYNKSIRTDTNKRGLMLLKYKNCRVGCVLKIWNALHVPHQDLTPLKKWL